MNELKQEMINFIKREFKGLYEIETEDFNFDMEAAIYWYANNYYKGQGSDLYSILSTSEFKPSRLHRGINDEGEMAIDIYQKLVNKYQIKGAL